MSTTHPPDPIGPTATETPVAVPAAGRSDDGDPSRWQRFVGPGATPAGSACRRSRSPSSSASGGWSPPCTSGPTSSSPTRARCGTRFVESVTTHDGRRGPSAATTCGSTSGPACGGSLQGVGLGDRRRRPARARCSPRSRPFRIVVEPYVELPAQPAAARLLQPADHLVRHRRHVEGLAAVPRRLRRRSRSSVVAGRRAASGPSASTPPARSAPAAARSLRHTVLPSVAARPLHRHPPRDRLRLDHDRRRRDRQRHPRHRRPGLGDQEGAPQTDIADPLRDRHRHHRRRPRPARQGARAPASSPGRARPDRTVPHAPVHPQPTPTRSTQASTTPSATAHRWRLAAALGVARRRRSRPAVGDDGDAASTTTRRRRPTPRRRRRQAPRHDHDRLPGHPQRRPRREARGLARGGASPTPTIEWKLFDSGGSVNEAILAGARRHRPRRLEPGLPRHLARHRVPGAVDPRRHRRGRGARRASDDIASIDDLEGQDDRHAVRVDRRTTACSPRSRTPASTPTTSNIIDAEPDDIYAAWTARRHRRRLRVEPEPGQDHRRRRQGADHQRRPGREGQDHLRPRRRHATTSPRSTPTPCRPGSSSRTRPSSCIQDDPDAAAAAVAAELEHHARGGAAPSSATSSSSTRRRAGRRRTTSAAAWPTNLFAAAEFNKELGEIDAVQPESAYQRRRRRRRFAEAVAASDADDVDAIAGGRPGAARRRCRGVATATRPARRGATPSTRSTSTIEPGEFVRVVGPSGCGKTTLLQLLAGFLTPTDGHGRASAATPVTGPAPTAASCSSSPTSTRG